MEEMKPNRNRSRQVKFWVNEDEYELLQKKMEAALRVSIEGILNNLLLPVPNA